ncbi:hypothetical protein [Leucobacter massiliensis]|uniref:Putative 4-hydroxy-4-methyl-2-oxoglutarate aldolase n=1 Tax=Leucobacter massiliensis TaxID=1686285 RepID=A0A2S9QL20_9MICO|nr:hypothetical protein [Leucobacter massiliensis]PRI10288.1 hypothetical protein B4915_12910 [Leucobacter massiliensis]
MTHHPSLRLVNLGGVSPDLERCLAFFEAAPGTRVLGHADASGTPYLRLALGPIAVNLFVQPVFTASPVTAGWSHVSLETDRLQPFLDAPEWAAVMTREPWTIETLGESRRIAFFEPAPGLRVEIMEITRELPPVEQVPGVSTVYEAQGRRGEAAGLTHRAGPPALLGRALTVQCQTGDNLAVHRAVARATAGDVLVIAGGDASVGYVGDILVRAAVERGIAGLIVDGGVRDIDELRSIGLPVWSTRVAITGATKVSPGRIGEPLVCAGAAVERGDVVRADSDGVVFVAVSEWPAVLHAARERDAFEESVADRLRAGETTLQVFGLRD